MHVIRISLLLLLAACIPSQEQGSPYTGPESLLQQSREVVTVPLNTMGDVKNMTRWMQGNRPTDVSLQCTKTSAPCVAAAKILSGSHIAFHTVTAERDNIAVLTYVRAGAADCNPQVVDNTHNIRNLTQPQFGCAISSNAIRMISNSEQLTDPNNVDGMDAEKALSVVKTYQAGSSTTSGSLLQTSGSQ